MWDYIRETFRGRSIYRILFQREVYKNYKYIKGSVLDIGSGANPSYLKYLPKGIDYKKTDYVKKDGVDEILDFNQVFPFEDNSFDTVLLFHNLYIAKDPHKTIGEVKRVLKPNGFVLISSPFGMNIMAEPNDFRRFTKEGLDNLFNNLDMEIVYVKSIGDRFSVIANTLHAFLLIAPIRIIFNSIAIICDKLIPRGMKKNHPFPIGYFYVVRK